MFTCVKFTSWLLSSLGFNLTFILYKGEYKHRKFLTLFSNITPSTGVTRLLQRNLRYKLPVSAVLVLSRTKIIYDSVMKEREALAL